MEDKWIGTKTMIVMSITIGSAIWGLLIWTSIQILKDFGI